MLAAGGGSSCTTSAVSDHRQDRSKTENHAPQVHGHELVEIRHRDLFDTTCGKDSRVQNSCVQAAEALTDQRYYRFVSFLGGYIGRHTQ